MYLFTLSFAKPGIRDPWSSVADTCGACTIARSSIKARCNSWSPPRSQRAKRNRSPDEAFASSLAAAVLLHLQLISEIVCHLGRALQ